MTDWWTQAEKIGNVVGLWVFIAFAVAVLFGFKKLNGRAKGKIGDLELEYGPIEDVRGRKHDPRPSLIHHRLFHILRNAMSPGFVMDGSGPISDKRAINAVFIKECKVKVFYEGLTEFFNDLEKNKGSGMSKLPDKIGNLIEDYERIARKIPIELPDGTIICGVPSCYLKKFNVWHTPHIKLCLSGITEALDSRFYPDWWTRATVCLEYIAMAFDLTFEDAERTLEQLNGDLDREIAEMLCRDEEEVTEIPI